MPDLEVIIGLEVHAQMNTKTKMFCGCDNDAFGKVPNTTVCPICMGHPGTLPVPNEAAIEKAMKVSLAIGCIIRKHNHFDRKHYFYPDLPSGFQISQYDFPLAEGGSIEYEIRDTSGNVTQTKICGITRLHMENDAGKLTHRGSRTLCDYNRAGTPLMEIVTEPDLRSAEEASAFAQELRRILIAVNASEADMFKGMMRFDASLSLREKGTEKLNPRSEIKNLNSFRALERALQYEEKRLRREWETTNGPLPNDITVGWLDEEEKTKVLRNKESADDYRYFPEPDIPPIFIEVDTNNRKVNLGRACFIYTTNGQITEEIYTAQVKPVRMESAVNNVTPNVTTTYVLPRQQKSEYVKLGLDDNQAAQLIDQPALRAIFDAVHEKSGDAKRASSIVLTQLLGYLNSQEKEVSEGPDAEAILELIGKIDDGSISANAGKNVLDKMVHTGKNASTIIEEEGMEQISDDSAIEDLVQKAIDANQKAIEAYKAGKEQALGAIVGWVMKESKGQANPGKVNKILKQKL